MVFAVAACLGICAGVLYWQKNKQIDAIVDKLDAKFQDTADGLTKSLSEKLHRLVHTARRLCSNKGAILVYTFQVIYQYANIVTGYEFDFDYPEPAKSVVEYLSAFGLNILSLSPPECVNPESNFYTRVLIASLSPLGVIFVGLTLVSAYNRCRGHWPRAEWHHALAYVLAFLEFVLSGVATVVCKTFVCEEIDGEGKVLVDQPTLLCEDLDGNASPTRRWFEIYSGLMIVLYPVGVPLLIVVSLALQKVKIKRVMRAKKALVVGELDDLPRDFFLGDEDEKKQSEELLREEAEKRAEEEQEEPSVEDIALRDSTRRHASPRQRSQTALFNREDWTLRQLKSSRTLIPKSAQTSGEHAALEEIVAHIGAGDQSLGIVWRAVRSEHGHVAVVESIDGRSSAFDGDAPRPGDRLVKIGDEHIAERFADSIRANRGDVHKAANDTVRSFIVEARVGYAPRAGPATVKLHVVRATRQVSPLPA